MRRSGIAVLPVALALVLTACGGGDRTARSGKRAASPEAAQLKYCVEGAGARATRAPDGEPEVKGARQELVILWPSTGHSGDVYVAQDEDAARSAAEEFEGGEGVLQKGDVIFVPDSEHRPTSDEALLVDDCLVAVR